MITRYIIYAVLTAAGASSQSFSDVIAGQPELTNLSHYMSGVPQLQTIFNDQKNVTVLAPNDAAFNSLVSPQYTGPLDVLPSAKLINAILEYHLLKGTYSSANISNSPVFIPSYLGDHGYENVSSGQVVEAYSENDKMYFYSGLATRSEALRKDIQFDNGQLHIINKVLMLPQNVADSAYAANLTDFMGAMGIGKQLDGTNWAPDITVFAPNNAAFQRINAITANAPDSEIARALNYHIIPGQVVHSSDMTNKTLPTIEGTDVHMSVIDGVAFINSAKIVATDLLVNNGVLHVLEDVLNPNNSTLSPDPNATPQPVAYGGAGTQPYDRLTAGISPPTSVIALPAASSISGGTTAAPAPTPPPPAPTSPPNESSTSPGMPPPGAGSGSDSGSAPPTGTGTGTDTGTGTGTSTSNPPSSSTTSESPAGAPIETARAGIAAVLGICAIMLNA